MQNAEVWRFSPPSSHITYLKGSFDEKSTHCNDIISSHSLNHLISVTIPVGSLQVQERIRRLIEEDCDYYHIASISISELIKEEFVEAFIKRGHLTLLSDGTRLDLDNCVALTPSGHLVLSLCRHTYQELGIEGKSSLFFGKESQRYVIDLDLRAEHFTLGKKAYERLQTRLADAHDLTFNVLVAWEPEDLKVCPSSVASYVVSRGFVVSLCQPRSQTRHESNIAVPIMGDENDGNTCSSAELLEWLGAFSHGIDLKSASHDESISTYAIPTQNQVCDQIVNLTWSGLFTVKLIDRLFKEIRQVISSEDINLWASLHVQGFSDSPINWGLKEHQFYTNGDNNYTIFARTNNFLVCSVLSSNKRPKKKTNSK